MFEAHSGPSDLPPVRRTPPQKRVATAVSDADNDGESNQPGEAETTVLVPVRRGSPFADRGTVVMNDCPDPIVHEALDSKRRSYGASTAAAALTFPIGILGLVLAFYFPIGGVVIAAFGIAIGTWGLYSPRRGIALSGLLLCCLCLALAGFNAAVELYVHFYGIAPWETSDPVSTP